MSQLPEILHHIEMKTCSPDWGVQPGESDEQRVDRLLTGFMYWCENYIHIRHPERGKIKFNLRPAQIDTVHDWLTHRDTLALKARQIGFSTLVSVYCLWLTFFYPDRQIIMISKGEREAAELLDKAKYAYRFMDDWMRLMGPMVNMTQTEITMSNSSVMSSRPSASDPARGSTAFTVVVDEIGFLPNSEQAWASIEPVADVGGRVIMLGTANGEGNLFHREWLRSERFGNGAGRFWGIFHPWSANDDRDEAWYLAKAADTPEWQMHQEYPSNPDEAFLKSGRPVFDVEKLRAIECVRPERGFLAPNDKGISFIEQDDGFLRVWERPKVNGVYMIGSDVAEGLEHGDFSVAHVIDARTHEVVAVWHGHIDADVLGEHTLHDLGRWYNSALIGVESNNHGLTTLKALQRTGYTRIFRQRRMGSKSSKPTDALGWRTTTVTKPVAIDELAKVIRDEAIVLLDSETISELRQFQRRGDGKMAAPNGQHDDRVMSLAIAHQMSHFVWLPQYRVEPKPPPGTWGFFMNHMFEDSPDSVQDPRFGHGHRAA